MVLYSRRPARLARQVVADVAVLLWIAGCALVGRAVHDIVAAVRAPVDQLASLGATVDANLASAASGARDIPLVGDRLGTPLEGLRAPAQQIVTTAGDVGTQVDHIASLLGWSIAVFPAVAALVLWLLIRGRFARRAAAAAAAVRTSADVDLFALRALATQPVHRLTAAVPDPAAAWRRRDPEALRALAALELLDLGVRP